MRNISCKGYIVFSVFLGIFLFGIIPDIFAQDSVNSSVVVEANIIGFSNGTAEEGVSIEVPDYFFLGNVTREKPATKDLRVDINNTGTVPVIITPMVKNEDEEIFKYLFFRTMISSGNESNNIFYRIGDYSYEIDKPAAGSRANSKHFYMSLNLSDFEGVIREDLIPYRSEIIFLAMAKV